RRHDRLAMVRESLDGFVLQTCLPELSAPIGIHDSLDAELRGACSCRRTNPSESVFGHRDRLGRLMEEPPSTIARLCRCKAKELRSRAVFDSEHTSLEAGVPPPTYVELAAYERSQEGVR